MSSHKGSWVIETDIVHNWAYWNEVFTKEECKEIIKIGENKVVEKAFIENNIENNSIRESEISFIYPSDAVWAYQKITNIVESLNNQFFKFNIFGMVEGMQFTKYTSPSGFYGMHMDKMFNNVPRKLSVVIQLSDQSEYEGGELILHTSSKPEIMDKSSGKLIAFPSYIMHEVKPVTKGTRYSLVFWLTGEQFK